MGEQEGRATSYKIDRILPLDPLAPRNLESIFYKAIETFAS